MGKDVVVIASGERERRSLPQLVNHLQAEDIIGRCGVHPVVFTPQLVNHLQAEDIDLVEVRIPPGGKALNVEMAEKLLKASRFERIAAPPDKFVVLVDADGKAPDDVVSPFREQLPRRVER